MHVYLEVETESLALPSLWFGSSGPLEPCTISLWATRPEEPAPWSPPLHVPCRRRCWPAGGCRRSSSSTWQRDKRFRCVMLAAANVALSLQKRRGAGYRGLVSSLLSNTTSPDFSWYFWELLNCWSEKYIYLKTSVWSFSKLFPFFTFLTRVVNNWI